MSSGQMNFLGWFMGFLAVVMAILDLNSSHTLFIAAVIMWAGAAIVSRLPTPPHTGKD